MKVVKFEMNKLIEKANDGDIFEASHMIFDEVEAHLILTMKEIESLRKILEVAARKSEDIDLIKRSVRISDGLAEFRKEAQDKFRFRIEVEQAARAKATKKKRDPKDEVVI